MGKYFCMSCAMSSLFCGQPFLIYAISSYRCTSLTVTYCTSCIDVHTGSSIAVSIPLLFILKTHTSLSSFSSWLCYDSQSAMNSSRLGLYSMHTLYWFMHRIIHCRHCEEHHHIFAHYSYQWFMVCHDMYFTCKTVNLELFQPMQDTEYFSIYTAVPPLNAK